MGIPKKRSTAKREKRTIPCCRKNYQQEEQEIVAEFQEEYFPSSGGSGIRLKNPSKAFIQINTDRNCASAPSERIGNAMSNIEERRMPKAHKRRFVIGPASATRALSRRGF